MKITPIYSLLCVFNILELFYYQHVEAISREVSWDDEKYVRQSYPLGTVLGKKTKSKYHGIPLQVPKELLTTIRIPVNFQIELENNTPTEKKKKKKKLKRKNRRRHNQQTSTMKNHKNTATNKKKKKKKRLRKKVKAYVRNKDGKVVSKEVTSKISGKLPRKPVDIVVHIKMDDVDYVI